jgi:hypothetical protein
MPEFLVTNQANPITFQNEGKNYTTLLFSRSITHKGNSF